MRDHTNAAGAAPIQLEIFFDLACPFTLLAKAALDGVLANAAVPVDIKWSPLILLPWMPPEGLDFQSSHLAKYGERSRPLQLQVERMGESAGIRIDHTRITKVPNTLDAHRAVQFAAQSGRTDEMIEAILRGYFSEGRDIGDRRTLGELVYAVGLNASEFRSRIVTNWLRAEVLAAHHDSVSRGAKSVPSYRLDGAHIENTKDMIPRLRELTAG